jgi:hypothetical protein
VVSSRVCALVLVAACGRFGFDDQAVTPGGPDGGDAPHGLARNTIEPSGAAGGTIVGPDGFSCGPAAAECTLAIEPGKPVWLRGLPATDAWFAGWTGKCGGNFTCEFTATTDLRIEAEFAPQPNRVFVTSTVTTGAFGGIAGGDAICAARATAAGLSGTFIAYLSDSTTDAPSRLAGSRGWVRVDGAPFADLPAAFSTGAIVFPPRLDELGIDVGNATVFTGTDGGTAVADLCLDWTSAVATEDGGATRTHLASGATGSSPKACSSQNRLMCVEIGRSVAVTLHADPDSPVAFMSRTLWTPGAGRASADAVCAADATSAALPGTFLAAISTTTESIESRFAPGQTYRRVDGVRLLRSPGMFLADYLDVPPELDQRGAVVGNDYWTGTRRFSVAGQASDTCSDWSTASALIDGEMHYTASTDIRTSAKREPCNTPLPVLCLQQ